MDLVGRLTYAELFKATDGFSPRNLAGVGSFGSVYKANIGGDHQLCAADPTNYNNNTSGKLVAVKVINLQQQGGSKSFMAECEALRNIRHRNLLKILTSCSSIDHSGNSFKALVFEYMTNGSLDKWLHPAAAEGGADDDHDDEVVIRSSSTSTRGGLSLMQRLSIAIDVASALEYLHVGSHRRIIHCDLKPSNVLLDDEMTAHVADFGLARFLASTDHTTSAASTPSSLSAVRGTVGYAAPEYGMGCKPSTQGDVYSYGILLLEMITGRRPTDAMFKEEFTLRKFVETSFPARVLDVVDQKLLLLLQVEETVLLRRDHHGEEITTGARFQNGGESTTFGEGTREYCVVSSMLSIALRCSNESPRERMNMEDVVKEMIATRNAFQIKRRPHGKLSHDVHGVRGGQRMLTDHHASTALI